MNKRLKTQILDSLSYHLDELVDSRSIIEEDEWEEYQEEIKEIEWAISEVNKIKEEE